MEDPDHEDVWRGDREGCAPVAHAMERTRFSEIELSPLFPVVEPRVAFAAMEDAPDVDDVAIVIEDDAPVAHAKPLGRWIGPGLKGLDVKSARP